MSCLIFIKKLFSRNSNGILSYYELCELVERGVIDAPMSNVNGSSIDVTLDRYIRVEEFGSQMNVVRLHRGETVNTREIDMFCSEHIMMPDSTVLASTLETLHMPNNLSAEFSLKSSVGRSMLAHQLAGWIDPGFVGRLTLELKNENQFNKLGIAPNMKVGQIKFFRHKEVPKHASYSSRGQYMHQDRVTASKGIK